MKFRLRHFNRLTRPDNWLKLGKVAQRQIKRASKNLLFDPVAAVASLEWLSNRDQGLQAQNKEKIVHNYKGQFIAGSFNHEAGMRNYKLYIPPNYDRSLSVPLIVMLHGCTQDADDFAAGTRMNDMAELCNCIVLYPEQNKKYNGRACWNWFKPEHQARDTGEPAILSQLTKQIIADYAIDANRVYIAGLSAGGAMAAIMAATYSDLYAAVGIHSGLAYQAAHDIPSVIHAMKKGGKKPKNSLPKSDQRFVPTIIFHGDSDKTVHVKNADHILSLAKSDLLQSGVKAKKVVHSENGYTHAVFQDQNGKIWLEDWRLHEFDHVWSGGNTAGSYASSKGPNASEKMLNFFLTHQLE